MEIYNSLSQTLEKFKPLLANKVTMYVCGITPYDTTHLGHAFTYISFDGFARFLKLKGYQVIYTQNVTDINDRDKDILERARIQNISWQDLAQFWTKKFLTDMEALNWTKPNFYLKASEQIDSMIQIIKALLKKDLAYQVNKSIYLDVSKVKGFGKLSKLTEKQMLEAAASFEEDLENPDKRKPLDVTLWRTSTKTQASHIPSFDSPFGPGRPGWHIECSAMSIKSLGEQIDIHGGGRDLKFPHHDAEIAQSEGATGKIPFAKYWLHTGVVSYKGEKMSKSLGNLIMISDLLKKYSPNAIRFFLLSHKWRESWEFREQDLINAQKCVNLIENAIAEIKQEKISDEGLINTFIEIVDNDFDTPKGLQFLLQLVNNKNDLTSLKKLYIALGFKIKRA